MTRMRGCLAPVLVALLDAACGSPTHPATTGTDDPTESSAGDESSEDGAPEPDVAVACDGDAQDCESGEKCAPVEDGDALSCMAVGMGCVEIQGDLQIGDFCTRTLDGDDCGERLYCNPYGAPAEYGWDCYAGVCAAICESEWPSPSEGCKLAGVPGAMCVWPEPWSRPPNPLCVLRCDPIAQDCEGELRCYEMEREAGWFNCLPPHDIQAGIGSPCAGFTQCQPGLTCVSAELLASCDSENCCSPICDPSDLAFSCPGEGEVCEPLNKFGFCRLPK